MGQVEAGLGARAQARRLLAEGEDAVVLAVLQFFRHGDEQSIKCLRRIRPQQMLRTQCRVAHAVERRHLPVQLFAQGLRHCIVKAMHDQVVDEQVTARLDFPQQALTPLRLGHVVRLTERLAPELQLKAIAEHCGVMQSPALWRGETLNPRLHQMPQAVGDNPLLARQQLREVQRIALGTDHAVGTVGRIDLAELLSQQRRLACPDRGEVEQAHGAGTAWAQLAFQRISLGTGGQQPDDRRFAAGIEQPAEHREEPAVTPVQVFHDDQQRLLYRNPQQQLQQCVEQALRAGLATHRRVQRLLRLERPIGALHACQHLQEYQRGLRHFQATRRSLQHLCQHRRRGAQAQQAERQLAERPEAMVHAEIQHIATVTGEPALPGHLEEFALEEFADQTALADTRHAPQIHHVAVLTLLGGLDHALELQQLYRPAHQRPWGVFIEAEHSQALLIAGQHRVGCGELEALRQWLDQVLSDINRSMAVQAGKRVMDQGRDLKRHRLALAHQPQHDPMSRPDILFTTQCQGTQQASLAVAAIGPG